MKCEIEGYENIVFEVGLQWLTGDGELMEVTYIEKDPTDRWPIKCNHAKSFMVNGIYSSDKTKSNQDLVSLPIKCKGVNMGKRIKCEVAGYEHIEFKVGQMWQTRGGRVVEIVAVYNDIGRAYPIETLTNSYKPTGKEFELGTTENDLITLVNEPFDESVEEPVCTSTETYKDNEELWEYSECSRIKVEEDNMLAPICIAEPSVEDKMVDILHQLLAQRVRDLEKISLMFDTFMKLEKMK